MTILSSGRITTAGGVKTGVKWLPEPLQLKMVHSVIVVVDIEGISIIKRIKVYALELTVSV